LPGNVTTAKFGGFGPNNLSKMSSGWSTWTIQTIRTNNSNIKVFNLKNKFTRD